MKDLLEMMEVSKDNLPEIYCDMDQVLCNFIGRAEEVIGMPFAKFGKDDRWIKIRNTKDFWANLDWMPGAKRLYSFIQSQYKSNLSRFI